MSPSDLYAFVHWTARVSALLFAAALAAPVLLRLAARRSRALYLAFMVAHTIHFAFVTWLATAIDGAGMFPGGRDMAEVGGWKAVFAIFTFFYALAFLGLRARSADLLPRWLRVAGKLATSFIGYMFVATYVPLVDRSPWYALPAAIVVGAVLVDVTAGRLRKMRCFSEPDRERA